LLKNVNYLGGSASDKVPNLLESFIKFAPLLSKRKSANSGFKDLRKFSVY
jgi:hypothetical protein